MLDRSMLALVAFVAATLTVGAMAGTPWAFVYSRPMEVNRRLVNQNQRIDIEMKSDETSRRQVAMLHTYDRQSCYDELATARQGSGHITKLDERGLNQQKNRVNI